MLALSRFFYVVAGSCALYVSLAPFFSSWHGSPSFFSLAYWICAILLFAAAILPPSKNSATLALISSAFLSTRLGFRLTRSVACKLGLIHASAHSVAFPPTAFDRVNHIMKMPVAITLLISALASLVISVVVLWRLQETEDVVSLIRSNRI
jgi:uncharacterized membrane protein